MIDDRENNEYADDREDAPPGDTGKTEAPYEDGPDDSAPRGMSTGVKVLIGCGVAFGGLVLLAAIAAGFIIPALLTGREEAWKTQCANNLKQIYPAATAYADKKYEFPNDKSVDEPLAHDSLNLLLRSLQGRSLSPRLFKCPAGEAAIALTDEDEKFQLDEDTLDYAWAIVRRKPTGKPMPLASDKYYKEYNDGDEHEGHEGIIHVLFTDGSVETWDVEDPAVQKKMDMDTGLPIGLGR
jgi:hypothetical protein